MGKRYVVHSDLARCAAARCSAYSLRSPLAQTSWTKVLDYNDGEQHVRFRAVPLLGGPGRLDDEMTGLIIVGGES